MRCTTSSGGRSSAEEQEMLIIIINSTRWATLRGPPWSPHDREMFIIFLQMRKNVVREAAKCLNYNRDVSHFVYISAIVYAGVWHPLFP